MSRTAFESLVEEALDKVPIELMELLDNVVFLIEDEPENTPEDTPAGDGDLLGLYVGVPLTERDLGWGSATLPDRIMLYRGPLTRLCADVEELRQEVVVTVIHEITHHFGIEEERLHDLGWG